MRKIILGLTALVAFIESGCNRTSDIIGPAACPSDAFAITAPLVVKDITSSSTTDLDLSASHAKITAAFNESISYTLTITGSVTGAKFVQEGKANNLSLDWYGNSTNGKYFQQGEYLQYTLKNLCKTEPLGSGSIHLITTIGYSGFGLKVINYEDTPPQTRPKYGVLTATSSLMTPSSPGYVASPQGTNYYNFKAIVTPSNDSDGDGDGVCWYMGGSDFDTTGIHNLNSDPTKVYLNFFAKGFNNSQAQMIIGEQVHGVNLTRKFLANVSPDKWTLYSVRLSDIGIIDPSKIQTLSFNLGAALHKDNYGEVDLDLVIFTNDKPF